MLVDLLTRDLAQARRDGDTFFDAVQNARLVAGAERYYRVMYYGASESWNLRDTHMFLTLKQIMDHVGPSARAVVWAPARMLRDVAGLAAEPHAAAIWLAERLGATRLDWALPEGAATPALPANFRIPSGRL